MKLRLLLISIIVLVLVACSKSDEPARLPNEDGASILIVSPASSSVHPEGRAIELVVVVENFALGGEANNHWHIYLDGENWGMIFGEQTSYELFGVTPGEHEISVYLANNEHVEYANGDTILLTVE